jgi:UDP-N-acetylmuramate dehydrogenase
MYKVINMADSRIQEFVVELWNRFPEQVRRNEPMRSHTTYQVGGPATAFCQPESVEVLEEIVKSCYREKIPVYLLGTGSNVLINDNHLDMIVINLERCCAELTLDGKKLYAGAGVLVSDLVDFCERHDLAGLDFMAGIPGMVGGALRMNAGAFVGEIGDRVLLIDAMSYQGDTMKITKDKAGFGYRQATNLQDKIMLGCQLELLDGSREDLQKSKESYLQRRSDKQPLDYGSCGSVFKRPQANYAGALIEQAGCKGLRIGGAMVSEKHANFIINYQNATAMDIYRLIVEVQEKVYRKFKVWLELEVKLIGFSPAEEAKVRNPHE